MKTLTLEQIMQLAKCSKSTALEIKSSDLLETKKLYLNKSNNSTSTLSWLEKNFEPVFTQGNDAPRGGKGGEFVIFQVNDKFNNLVELVNEKNEESIILEKNKKSVEQEKINAMVISEIEKENFLAQTKDLSNKKAREIAHRFACKNVGFYNNCARDKFMSLRN